MAEIRVGQYTRKGKLVKSYSYQDREDKKRPLGISKNTAGWILGGTAAAVGAGLGLSLLGKQASKVGVISKGKAFTKPVTNSTSNLSVRLNSTLVNKSGLDKRLKPIQTTVTRITDEGVTPALSSAKPLSLKPVTPTITQGKKQVLETTGELKLPTQASKLSIDKPVTIDKVKNVYTGKRKATGSKTANDKVLGFLSSKVKKESQISQMNKRLVASNKKSTAIIKSNSPSSTLPDQTGLTGLKSSYPRVTIDKAAPNIDKTQLRKNTKYKGNRYFYVRDKRRKPALYSTDYKMIVDFKI